MKVAVLLVTLVGMILNLLYHNLSYLHSFFVLKLSDIFAWTSLYSDNLHTDITISVSFALSTF